MALSQDFRTLLEELFREVEMVPEDRSSLSETRPYLAVGEHGPDSLLFRGRALQLMQQITAEHAEHWGSGGWTAESINHMVVEACRTARTGGPEAGIQAFRRRLVSPPLVWVVYFSATDIFYREPAEGVAVGGVTYSVRDIPELSNRESALTAFGKDVGPPFWRVQVAARDEYSAHFLANEQVEQARAMLSLSDHSIRRPLPRAVLTRGDAWTTASTSPHLVITAFDSDGRLRPGYRELSEAAQRPEIEREDWHRRVLSASRWYMKGATTPWYAEALSATMTALECLLIRDRHETNKGRLIGERATRIVHLRRVGESDQPRWLEDLYKRRNDAVHEGLSVVEDLHVEALVALTGSVCSWSLAHLTDLHRDDGGRCRTFDEVHDPTLHP